MLCGLKKQDFFPLVTSFQGLSVFEGAGHTGDTAKLGFSGSQKILHQLQLKDLIISSNFIALHQSLIAFLAIMKDWN